jgi:hypothetical protein
MENLVYNLPRHFAGRRFYQRIQPDFKPFDAHPNTPACFQSHGVAFQRRRQLKALVLSLKSMAALRRSSTLPQTSRPFPLQSLCLK